jgi:hypothetical protein
VDLLLYPKLVFSEMGYGVIFSRTDIAKRRWKHAFEDLVNLGVIDVVVDYPSRDEDLRLMRLANDLPDDATMDLAYLAMHSQKREVPFLFRETDVSLLDAAARVVKEIADRPRPIDRAEGLERTPKSKVATWLLEMKIPRLFARSEQQQRGDLWYGDSPEECIFIDPEELVVLLKHRAPLTQLRDHVRRLAALDPSGAQARDYFASKRRSLQERLKVAEFVFEGVDLALLPIPPPFSMIASLLAKGAKQLTWWSLSHPYRWLLLTEKIDAKLADRS